jgi:hypothetical protein
VKWVERLGRAGAEEKGKEERGGAGRMREVDLMGCAVWGEKERMEERGKHFI